MGDMNGEHLVYKSSLVSHYLHNTVFEKLFIVIIMELCKHGTVTHIMTVYNGVKIFGQFFIVGVIFIRKSLYFFREKTYLLLEPLKTGALAQGRNKRKLSAHCFYYSRYV